MGWEDNVRRVVPYTPGEQPGDKNIIKLNTNECPYPPAPGVLRALRGLKDEAFRRYPDPEASVLREALAEYHGVDADQVFVGVGSDDVLALAFLTFFNSGGPILFPDITYSFYKVWAELFKIPVRRPALTEDFRINAQDYLTPNGGVVLPNPNAPTGVLEDVDTIEMILRCNQDSVVIVDEAYIDFGGKSALPLVEKYDNLLVTRTFSKSRAMAGMRIGFAIGGARLISYLRAVRFSFNSYPMSCAAIAAGVEAVRDDKYFRSITGSVAATRERMKGELSALGFHFPDSSGNFIFASHPEHSAAMLQSRLREAGIYVRHFEEPRIENYLRITVGTDRDMDAMLSFLKKIL